jgi:uncharacterized protein (TIGR04222 family)
MDWLFDNPLADLPGPQFLFLYAVFAGIVIIAAVFFVDMQDTTGALASPPIPQDPDPYELAYLRGGVNEVIRTAIYALRQQRLIEIIEKGRIRATGAAPGGFELTRLERRVFEAIAPAPLIAELFKGQNLRDDVERLCAAYRQRLAPQQLLTPPEVQRAARYALPIGIGLLVAAAAYKIFAAILHGRSNLAFLFMEAAAACFLVYWLVRKTSSGNASKRGKAWLTQIQLAYSRHVASAFGGGAANRDAAATALGASALFMVGLFGFSILKGTPDAALAQQFAASQSGGGDGGGGCGGGDGGGGGGCGGCGGGGD